MTFQHSSPQILELQLVINETVLAFNKTVVVFY